MGLFSRKKEETKKEETNVSPAADAKKEGTKELYKEDKIPRKQGVKNRYDGAYRIIVKPLITEKASILAAENKYVFAIAKDANKIETAKAIEAIYGVKPIKVNIIKRGGKFVRYGHVTGKRKDWKKAIITLPKGASIKVYEGV